MISSDSHSTQAVVAGGGLAGMVAALELARQGIRVTLLERGSPDELGGLARLSFGGIFFVGSPHQRRSGIQDNPELALKDWHSFAEFGPDDHWPKKWAQYYVESSWDQVGRWLTDQGVKFFPVVHWVEKGLFVPGNSVPRFHMVWGTGHGLVAEVAKHLKRAQGEGKLTIHFHHKVTDFIFTNGRVCGVTGLDEETKRPFEINAESVVVAAGGICGSLPQVRKHWYKPWGEPPETILNGSILNADGCLLDAASAKLKANLTHLDKMWLYAAGVHHPKPAFDGHGLSLVPPKSALWVNYQGKRIGDPPLVTGFDTRYLVQRICEQKKKYSWQILNYKIAKKELAVSGAENNEAIRDKKLLAFLKVVLLGNKKLVRYFMEQCKDFVVAYSLEELVEKMNALQGDNDVDGQALKGEVGAYDRMIERGPGYHNDDQLRRIAQSRRYRGDKARTCNFQKIVDPKAMPLIAIREFILSRKSLGGMQTDLDCRVLNSSGKPIDGLYAVGESAGFGGGGMHGLRSLEGTFLGACVLTGRQAARAIAGKQEG